MGSVDPLTAELSTVTLITFSISGNSNIVFKSIFSRIIELIEKFLKNKSISVQPKIIHHIMNFIERTYVDAFQAAEAINHLLYENNHNINLSLISEYYEQVQRPLS